MLACSCKRNCTKNVNDFGQISLSHQTVSRRIHIISSDICKTLAAAAKKIVYFLMAFDETTDIVDTSQIAVYIRGVTRKTKVTEEFLDVVSLKERTSGKDIKEDVLK